MLTMSEIRITLQPIVSQSVRLGVESLWDL